LNDVQLLPAEPVRKGRFDEVFFLDLPNEAERKEILRMYLRKYFKCTVLEEHPLNCKVEAVFGKYGSPHEFIEVFGHFKDGETIKPHRVY